MFLKQLDSQMIKEGNIFQWTPNPRGNTMKISTLPNPNFWNMVTFVAENLFFYPIFTQE
jgi:hypothetical protein